MSSIALLTLKNQNQNETDLEIIFSLKSKNTREIYLRVLRDIYKKYGPNIGLKELSRYINDLHLKVEAREIAPKTFNLKMSAIRSFLRLTGKSYIIDLFVKNKIKLSYQENKHITEDRFFTLSEILKVIAYTEQHKPRTCLLIKCLFQSGARISEFLQLRFCDLKREDEHFVYFDVIGKGKKIRTIFFRKEIYAKIRELNVDNNDRYFFYTNKKKPLQRWHAFRMLNQVFQKSIGRKCSPHLIRHSAATYLLEQKEDIYAISNYLGHSSPQTTLSYYCHTKVNTVKIPIL